MTSYGYNPDINRETPLQTERIVSVDFFRGLAIFGVALIHSIMFGVFYTIDNTLAVIPLPLLIVLAPLVLLAPLAGLFAFISATAKVFISQERLTEGHSLKSVLQPILITSAALLVLHFLYTLIFRSPVRQCLHRRFWSIRFFRERSGNGRCSRLFSKVFST